MSLLLRRIALAASLGVAIGCASTPQDVAGTSEAHVEEAASLPARWPNHGSEDCKDHQNAEGVLYRHQYDANTVILRENKCFNYEANFIFVLFGHDKVLVQDTGSANDTIQSTSAFTAAFPLRDTVEGLITEWLAAHPNADGTARTRDSMELLVTHSHSHGDHTTGDYQFKNADGTPRPHTQIVGLKPEDVASFFHITDWPNASAVLDLGGRKLDVLPIPGHEAAHIAIFDHGTNILLSGDTLYPGHVFVNDWTAFRASTKRLVGWLDEKDAGGTLLRPVAHVLGNHIEKGPGTGEASFYKYGTAFQDPERKLELTRAHVDQLNAKVQELGPTKPPAEVFLADFAIEPLQ